MKTIKEMYEKIAHLFPKQKSPPKISNLEALNVILHILENGSKWRSLGKNCHTIYTRANIWSKNNVLRHAPKCIRILKELKKNRQTSDRQN